MTTRTSAFLSLLLPLLALCLQGSRASAQTAGTSGGTSTAVGGISWVLNKVGTDNYVDTSNQTPINKQQCTDNSLLTLSLTGIPPGYKYLETWVGTNCNEANRATRVGEMSCVYVTSKEQDPVTTADTNFQVPIKPMCDLGDGARTYYILPVNTVMGIDAVTTFATVTLQIDTTPPDAPLDVKGGSGETEIPVTWKEPADTFYYWVVIDTTVGQAITDGGLDASNGEDSGIVVDAGGVATAGTGAIAGAGGAAGASGAAGDGGTAGSGGTGTTGVVGTADPECPSHYLVPGAVFDPSPDKLPPGVISRFISKKVTSQTFSGDELGGTKLAAVAVIADDRGKNESVLSNVACLKVVQTTGFWDKYKAAGGDAEQGCACSTPGAGRHSSDAARAVWALGLLGLVAGWRARRRR